MDKELIDLYNVAARTNPKFAQMGIDNFYKKIKESDVAYESIRTWANENQLGGGVAALENFKKKSTETTAPKSTPAPSGSTPSSSGGVETPEPEPESIPEPKRESFLPKEFAPQGGIKQAPTPAQMNQFGQQAKGIAPVQKPKTEKSLLGLPDTGKIPTPVPENADIEWYKKNRPDLIREDGTIKGKGFFGLLENSNGGESSELSITSGDVEQGKDVLIPTLVPTLTNDEVKYLLSGKYNPQVRNGIDDVISKKAIDFAKKRKANGKPYFATKDEEGKYSSTIFSLDPVGDQLKGLEQKRTQPIVAFNPNAPENETTKKLRENEQNASILLGYENSQKEYAKSNDIFTTQKNVLKNAALTDPQVKTQLDNYEKTFQQKKTSANLNRQKADPIIQKEVDFLYKNHKGHNLITTNVNGVTVPDMEGIQNAVKEHLKFLGLPTDGIVYQMMKNKLQGQVMYKYLEPQIIKEAEKIFKQENKGSMSEMEQKEYNEFISKIPQVSKLKTQTDIQIKVLQKDIQNDSKQKSDALGASYTRSVKILQDSVSKDKDVENLTNQLYNQLLSEQQELVNQGKTTPEQADAYLKSDEVQKQVQSKVNEFVTQKYGQQFSNLYSHYLDEVNLLNRRAQDRYNRQADEVTQYANNEINKILKQEGGKFIRSEALNKKMQDAYEKAYGIVLDKEKKSNLAKVRDLDFNPYSNAFTTRSFYTANMQALGQALANFGSTFDIPSLEDLGERLDKKYETPSKGIQEWSDVLDPTTFYTSAGLLTGRMIPSITASTIVAATTRNAPAALRILAGGLVNYGTETADMTGGMKREVLQQTGDLAEANKAAATVANGQLLILPLYMLEFDMFFGSATKNLFKKVPTLAGKVTVATTTEFAGELTQEIYQGGVESSARKGEGVLDSWKYINYEENKKLFYEMLPIAPLSLVAGIRTGVSEQTSINQVKNYIEQNKILDKLSDKDAKVGQFLINTYFKKGADFTNTLAAVLYQKGSITKEDLKSFQGKIDEFKEFSKLMIDSRMDKKSFSDVVDNLFKFDTKEEKEAAENFNKYANSVISFRVFNEYKEAKKAFDESKDPNAKPLLEQELKEKEEQYKDFFAGRGANMVSVIFRDGTQYALTQDEFNDVLDDPKTSELFKSGFARADILTDRGRRKPNDGRNVYNEISKKYKEYLDEYESRKQRAGEANRGEPTATDEGRPEGGVERPAESETGVGESTVGGGEAVTEQPNIGGQAQPLSESLEAKKAEKRKDEIEKRGLNRLFPLSIDESTTEGKELLKQKEAQSKAIAELDAELDTEFSALEQQTQNEQQNEKVKQDENAKPLSEGVSGVRTEGEKGTEGSKLRAEEEVAAKKAEIERRRQESLSNITEILGGKDKGKFNSSYFINEGEYTNTYVSIHNTKAEVENEINVKYDAELKALEQSSVEETANALARDEVAFDKLFDKLSDNNATKVESLNLSPTEYNKKIGDFNKSISTPNKLSEAYHKAKADGSNPELVKAVEELLTPKITEKENAIQEPKTESVLPREQREVGETGGKREGVGQGKQGEKPAEEGKDEEKVVEEKPVAETEKPKPSAKAASKLSKLKRGGAEIVETEGEAKPSQTSATESSKEGVVPNGSQITVKFSSNRIITYTHKNGKWSFIDSNGKENFETEKTNNALTESFLKGDNSKVKNFEEIKSLIAVKNITDSLKSAGIEVKVIDDPKEFDKEAQKRGTGQNVQGMFISNEGVIYINGSKIKESWGDVVVWHEGIHPIVNILRNTNPKLLERIMKGAKEFANRNSKMADVVEFAEQYRMGVEKNSDGKFDVVDNGDVVATFDSEKQANDFVEAKVNDEFITETFARITSGDIKLDELPKGFAQTLIDLMNKILKALNIPFRVSDTGSESFNKYANMISDVLQGGRDVSEIVGAENVKRYENIVIGKKNGQFKVDSKGETSKEINKETNINRPFDNDLIEYTDIDYYDGKKAVGFLGDKQVVGNVESPTGVKLEGRGGGLYPVWANKNKLRELQNKTINKIKNAKIWATTDIDGGNRLLNALKNGSLAAIGTQANEGILGNKIMLEHYAELLNKSLSNYDNIIKENKDKKDKGSLEKLKDAEQKKKELIEAINNPLKTNFKPNQTFKDKIIDSLNRIQSSNKSTDIQKENAKKSLNIINKGRFNSVEELYDAMYDLSYEVRTNFFTKVFNITNSDKFDLPSIVSGVKYKYDKTIPDYANDPIFSNADYGDIVGFVEYDPKTLKLVKTEIEDEFHHKSYNYTIVGDIISIKYLNKFLDGRAIFYEAKPKSEGEKINKIPFGLREKSQAARGIMGAMPSSLISSEDVNRRQASYEKGEIPQFSKGSRGRRAFDETGFISTSNMIDIVASNNPNYLGDVMQHIIEMGDKLKKGAVTTSDLSKAYMMAVSSIMSGDINADTFENNIGEKVDPAFLEPNRKIRTEGAMAYLLTTDKGSDLIKHIQAGKITEEDKKFISNSMKPFGMFGEGQSKYDSLFGATDKDQINLTNINEFRDLLKDGVKSTDELFDKIRRLKQISQGKVGFIANFLGIGERGVIDTREIKGWLRGYVFKDKLTDQELSIQRDLTKSLKDLTPLQKEILNRMREVGRAMGIDENLAEYIGHHMIWDAVAKERTTHDGLYLAMKQNRQDFDSRLRELSERAKAMPKFSKGERGQRAEEEVYQTELTQDDKDLIFDIVQAHYEMKDRKKGAMEKKAIKADRDKMLEKNQGIKRIFENITNINNQLEQKGLINKKGDCP